jgi:hypothetical protein
LSASIGISGFAQLNSITQYPKSSLYVSSISMPRTHLIIVSNFIEGDMFVLRSMMLSALNRLPSNTASTRLGGTVAKNSNGEQPPSG